MPGDEPVDRHEVAKLVDATTGLVEQSAATERVALRILRLLENDRIVRRSLWTLCRAWLAAKVSPTLFDDDTVRSPTHREIPLTARDAMESLTDALDAASVKYAGLDSAIIQMLTLINDDRVVVKDIAGREGSALAWVGTQLRNPWVDRIATGVVASGLTALAMYLGLRSNGP